MLCPKCGEPLLFDPETGEYVCRNGHVIVEHVVDKRREWKAGDREELLRRSRVGAPIRFSDPNPLSTLIGVRRGGGRSLERLRRVQRRVSMDAKAKRKTTVVELMKEAASKLNLPPMIIEEASRMYSKIEREDGSIARGRRLAPLALALLYYASKTLSVSRSLDDFIYAGSMWGVGKGTLKKAVRNYYMLLRERHVNNAESSTTTKKSVLSYISRIASKLGVSPRAERLAKELAAQINYASLAGRNPRGLAAAILSVTCNILNENIRQVELSKASGVSTVTIRKRKREIFESYTIEVIPEPRKGL